MNAVTVRTLTWFAVAMLAIAAMIPAPMGTLGLSAVSAVLSLIPLLWGSNKIRAVGFCLLLAALTLMLDAYPEAKNEKERYTHRMRGR